MVLQKGKVKIITIKKNVLLISWRFLLAGDCLTCIQKTACLKGFPKIFRIILLPIQNNLLPLQPISDTLYAKMYR
jgi:hypothetical protein